MSPWSDENASLPLRRTNEISSGSDENATRSPPQRQTIVNSKLTSTKYVIYRHIKFDYRSDGKNRMEASYIMDIAMVCSQLEDIRRLFLVFINSRKPLLTKNKNAINEGVHHASWVLFAYRKCIYVDINSLVGDV